MNSRIRNKMAAALVGVALAVGAAPALSLFTGTAEASTTSLSNFDQKLLLLINQTREAHGLRPLAVTSDQDLSAGA